MIKCLNGTKKKYLTLIADDFKVIKWYVDASFLVQPNFKSHTGEIMTDASFVVQPNFKTYTG